MWRMRFGVTGPGNSACPEVHGVNTRVGSNLLEYEDITMQLRVYGNLV